MSTAFHSGYVTFIGRPNAGKSTLLNKLLGTKLAITSAKPQTTRDRIMAVHTDERMQAVLLDTPGVHKATTELNKSMVRRAEEALEEADVVFWLEDAALLASRMRKGLDLFDPIATSLIEMLKASGSKVIFLANKMDLIKPQQVLPILDAVQKALPLTAAVPVSALTGDATEALFEEMYKALPEGGLLYPEDYWTDATERFLVAETIREQILKLTKQEVPYSTYVEVESFDESERDTKGLLKLHCVIVVERPQQKGILIGKRGAMLKKIGTASRQALEPLLDAKVFLKIFVKVEKNWTRTEKGLKKVGFER